MSGIGAVIARIDAIESQIVSLDPVARAADATESTSETGTTDSTSAAMFSGVLEAAKAAASTGTTTPESVVGAVTDDTTGEKNAELVSALQTLFSASASGSSSSSSASMQKLIEMIG